MEAKLLHIPWMVSVLYSSIPLFWFAIHPFADFWRKMNRSPYLLLLPIWAAIISVLVWATWPWHSERLYSSLWMWIPAALLMFFGLRTYTSIRTEFGAHKLSGEAELRPQEHEQELVTTGLHARMRHPIYFAHLANLAGWTLGSGLAISFVLLGASLFLTFPLMIILEERELADRLGEPYRIYQSIVPALPFLKLRKPDPRKSVVRLFQSLLLELPQGSARLETKNEYKAVLVPFNSEAATIWGRWKQGEYIVHAGNGAYHEHFENPNEVLAFCRWVIAGNLEETVWMKGDSVVGSGGSGGNNTFLLWGFNPFRRKIVIRKKYSRYAMGGSSS